MSRVGLQVTHPSNAIEYTKGIDAFTIREVRWANQHKVGGMTDASLHVPGLKEKRILVSFSHR